MQGLNILIVVFVSAIFMGNVVYGQTNRSCTDLCGTGAQCRNKQCKCRSGFAGDSYFACYNPRVYLLCQISADPMLMSFDKQEASIKMPASLSMTNLTTKRFGRGGGVCNVNVDAWGKRFLGKYFIEAIEFTVKQTVRGRIGVNSFRIISKVVNNQYFYTIFVKIKGKWVRAAVVLPTSRRPVVKVCFGCSIRFIRLRSKFLFVSISCCATRLAIRPHNPARPDVVPGMWVQVRKMAKMDTLPEGLCNAVNGPKFDNVMNSFGFNSRNQLMTYLGLANGAPTMYPGSFPSLPALQDILDSCPSNSRSAFMTKAEFLFNYEKLIECLGDKMMSIVFRVVKGFCKNENAACTSAISTIKTDCPDLKSNSQLNAFLVNGCV